MSGNGIPREILLILEAQFQRSTKPITKIHRPSTVPIQQYTNRVTVPISAAEATATHSVSAAGSAQVSVGPAGVGRRWYPAYATIATSSGANDNSTCAIYLTGAGQPATAQSLLVGQSYSGGGDTVGLTSPALDPGLALTALWTGGNSGDTASMTVYGNQDVLTL